MRNFVITYGLITGLVLGLFVIISTFFMTIESDLSNTENISNTIMFVVMGGFIYYAIKKYRDETYGGSITFGQVFIKGLLITLVASVIYSFIWTVYSSVSDLNFEEIYMEMMVREMHEDGATDEEIAIVVDLIDQFSEYYTNPVIKFFITIIEPVMPGVIATLIIGFLLRRKGENDIEISSSEE